jgi:response regulator RpfG family c-di-GMP phosphodiesterase
MNERILCVDDDPYLLDGYRRQLRKAFDVDTAQGADEGLAALAQQTYAVVVSDMRMPGMDGVQFLSRVQRQYPDSVRMMLSGNADLQVAIDAVNQGQIFRFLTKPCSREVLLGALKAGVDQYRLVTAERELLSKTLCGSVKLLTDVLGLVNPTAFGRAGRVRALAKQLGQALGVRDAWQVELAAMLCQVGCVAVPEEILAKVYRNDPLAPSEIRSYQNHPQIGRELLSNVPRLESVAEIVAFQEKRFDGNGPPSDGRQGDVIPLGARILKVALDYDTLLAASGDPRSAIAVLKSRDGWYDPTVLDALDTLLIGGEPPVRRSSLVRLPDNVVLADDVRTLSGRLLVAKGQVVTPLLKVRLQTHARTLDIREPIYYLEPTAEPAGAEQDDAVPHS